jgi:16S rRNA (guanine527-N7)-methyltransferase
VKLLAAGAAELGIHLSLAQIDQFRRYYHKMSEWNSRVNLTSVTGWEEVQTRHFLDSLTVSLAVPLDMLDSGRFVDIGSGAGFPGVPLKIAFPGLRATLVDSTAKKTAFLTYVSRELGLPDVDVRTGRAETLAHDPELRERYDFVLSRAVSSMSTLAELTLAFCRMGGIVVAHKTLGTEAQIRRAHGAIETMGGQIKEVREVAVKSLGERRTLVVLEKVAPSPARYPRRPGIPTKRPLLNTPTSP